MKATTPSASEIINAENGMPNFTSIRGDVIDEQDLVTIQQLANMNNCILKVVERDDAALRGKSFRIGFRPRRGIYFRTIKVPKDLTKQEYEELITAINPKYAGFPIEEVLAREGLKSMLQIQTGQITDETKSPERLSKLRGELAQVVGTLKKTEQITDKQERASTQAQALDRLVAAVFTYLPHVDYPLDAHKQVQSPRRTLRDLDAVCEQKTIFAHSLLYHSVALSSRSIRTYPVFVPQDYDAEGGDHACLLTRLSDGTYYMFDGNMPQSSGRIPVKILAPNSIKEPKGEEITNIKLENQRTGFIFYTKKTPNTQSMLSLIKGLQRLDLIKPGYLDLAEQDPQNPNKWLIKIDEGPDVTATQKDGDWLILAGDQTPITLTQQKNKITVKKQDTIELEIEEENPLAQDEKTAYHPLFKNAKSRTRFHQILTLTTPIKHVMLDQTLMMAIMYREQAYQEDDPVKMGEKLEKALQNFNHAKDLNPQDPQPHWMKGELRYRQSKVEKDLKKSAKYMKKAVSAYKKALEITPCHTDALEGLAGIYHDTGQKEKATQHYKKLLEVDHSNETAKERLDAFYSSNKK